MPKPSLVRVVTTLAAVAALSACGDAATDAEGDTMAEDAAMGDADMAVIEERQDNFEAIGDSFKVIRDQLEGDSPDFAAISEAAASINANAQKIEGYFPEGTGMDSGADTEALATIWEQPEDFAAAHQQLVAASEELMAAAETGDAAAVGAQIPNLGGACKNCHDTFRLDDE